MKMYPFLLLFYLANSMPLPAQGILFGNDAREYVNKTPAPAPNAKIPDYCHINKITITRVKDDEVKFSVELNGGLPEKDDRFISYSIHIDIDKSAETGGVAMWGFGSDFALNVARKANEDSFEAKSLGKKLNRKDAEVEIKKGTFSGNVFSFIAESDLFKKYPSFHFYVTSDLREGGEDGRRSSISVSQFPASGYLKY